MGMTPGIDPENIEKVGNSAGSGAVMTLCDESYVNRAIHIASKIEVVELACDRVFQNNFIKNLNFPVTS
ncbi:ASKHA domain-containing protein [Desulfospira joergensenii]|uniref:ASKHA domain-containing protein n=1 Tax=Desulfospira joergensenii TaxID=53329 RepID=UPI0004181F3B|nr:ASKHA domain-containing protein [Desulfospira joergensenii]